MLVGNKSLGNVTIALTSNAIPALRLLQWHAKEFRVECTDGKGVSHLVLLSDLDISHDTVAKLNVGRASYVPEPTGVHPVAPAASGR